MIEGYFYQARAVRQFANWTVGKRNIKQKALPIRQGFLN
jgi:hypothetical protein